MPAEKHAAANALESGVQIGDFKIERRIGAGGMGIVYAARQLSLNRVVALKVLGQALTRGVDVSRFHREAQAAAMLKHPAIAQVYFIGQDQHLCYLAMELIDGVSLRQAIDLLSASRAVDIGLDSTAAISADLEEVAKVVRFDVVTGEFAPDTKQNTPPVLPPNPYSAPEGPPRLSAGARAIRARPAHVRRCCEIARDAALALAHAHSLGVIHRDIKPGNLLLDRQKKVYLIDFGVARFFDDHSLTHTGQIVGTPIYMSPEQITGQKAIDARSDVYSLGLVLYELLTLRPAMESTSRENVFRSIITKPMPPLSWVNPAVPLELEGLVHRAAAKDADDRYPTAQEFADDLQRFLDGKPVVAPPYRFRFDEGEIIAARPSGVIVSAFILILGSSFISLILLCTSIMTLVILIADKASTSSMAGFTVIGFQAVSSLVIGAAGVVLGRHLLAGRVWARWTSVMAAFFQVVVCIGLLGGISLMMVSQWNSMVVLPPEDGKQAGLQMQSFMLGIGAMYGAPVLIGLILGVIIAYSLLTRKASNWFRLATRIRGEHRNLRSLLQSE